MPANAANAAARLKKALRASRVLNTSAPIAKARSNRRATKPATAQTNAPFAHAVEVTNYKPAICVPNTYALCVAAQKNQKVTTCVAAQKNQKVTTALFPTC